MVRCPKCKVGTCVQELLQKGNVNPTRTWDMAKLRQHVSQGATPCVAASVGATVRQRLGWAVTEFLYWQAELWVAEGKSPIHPLDLHRLGEEVRWFIDADPPEQLGCGEEGGQDPPSVESSALADSDSESYGADSSDSMEWRDKVMEPMGTKCPVCEVMAELGEGCDLSVVSCGSVGCPVSHWCVRCGLTKKLRVTTVVDAVPRGRCACKGALARNECFGALWETKWSVELTKMVEALAPASWNKTLRALRRIISAEAS